MSHFFYIVATVYVMLAGKPADTEGTKQYFQHKFETMDECKAFLNRDDFAQHRQKLTEMFVRRFPADQVPQITIVTECGEKKPAPDFSNAKDDGSI